MPATYHIELRQGNTMRRNIALKALDGTPTPLAGATLVWIVETRGTPITKTYLGNAQGTVALHLTAAETRELVVGKVNRYELEYQTADDEVTVLEGFMHVTTGINTDV